MVGLRVDSHRRVSRRMERGNAVVGVSAKRYVTAVLRVKTLEPKSTTLKPSYKR